MPEDDDGQEGFDTEAERRIRRYEAEPRKAPEPPPPPPKPADDDE